MENLFNYTLSSNGCGTFKIMFPGPFYLEYENKQFGLCHVIEHCMCERVKEIEDELNMHGIIWNAATGSNHVYFYISGLVKNVRKMIDKFLDCILNYKISKDVFEREIKIIKEEFYGYYKNIDEIFQFNFNVKKYNMYDPIGTLENIEKFTYEEMMEFKAKYFSKPMKICYSHPKGSKDLELNQINTKVEFSEIEYNKKEFSFDDYNEVKPMSFEADENCNIIRFHTGVEINSYLDQAYLCLFSKIIGDGLTSPLYKELREKIGDVYFIHKSQMFVNKKQIAFVIDLTTSTSKVYEVLDKFKVLINNIDKFINRKKFKIAFKNIQNQLKLNEYISIDYDNDPEMTEYKKYFLNNTITYNNFMDFVKKFMKSEKHFIIDKDL